MYHIVFSTYRCIHFTMMAGGRKNTSSKFYGINYREIIVKIQECTNMCIVLRYDVYTTKTIKFRNDLEEVGRNNMELYCFSCRKTLYRNCSTLIGIFLNAGENKLHCCVYCMSVCRFIDRKYPTARNECG